MIGNWELYGMSEAELHYVLADAHIEAALFLASGLRNGAYPQTFSHAKVIMSLHHHAAELFLKYALSRVRESSRVFVDVMGQVSGIVTKGDLQKAPVRMWLFGIISLLEMQFLRLIRKNEPWEDLITHERLKKVQEILADRRRHNAAIDLADCLQFCDKRTIVLKNEKLRTALGFETNDAGEDFLKQLENLRNVLDHSQDILTGRWPELVDLAVKAEEILQKAENYQAN